jgi:radical SAM/Cys-rich protein
MDMKTDSAPGTAPDFDATLRRNGLPPLRAREIQVLQVNVGGYCNLACRHCHVEGGASRTDMISMETMKECLRILDLADIRTVDLTGGAPELHPGFRWLVEACSQRGRRVIVRTNLVALPGPAFEELATFLRHHRVEIIASLPCYAEENVDAQRGPGVFGGSIRALVTLNRLGYGRVGTGLILNLAYNPGGPDLPPPQHLLEEDYRRELLRNHGVVFNHLLALVNMPIGRFRASLDRQGAGEAYLDLLVRSFSPATAEALMCRTTLSVGPDGAIYDCDFNQALGLTCNHGAPEHIRDFDLVSLRERRIVTGPHCFGCTAGAGSSCCGALT